MSGLLGNLVTQVAQNALNGNQSNGGMGDLLGGMLGSAIGGGQQDNSFGLDDVLGGVLASQMNNNQGSGGLGSVLSSVLGSGQQQSGSNKSMLMAMLIPMVLNWIQGKGGLSGALSQLQSIGLADQVNSWMSTSQQNINLDGGQIGQLFGSDQISQVADKAGVDQNIVTQGLGMLLPEIMNQLTPQGGLQDEQQADQEIGDILGQLAGLM